MNSDAIGQFQEAMKLAMESAKHSNTRTKYIEEAAGVSSGYLKRLMQDGKAPNLGTVGDICDVLGIMVEFTYVGDHEVQIKPGGGGLPETDVYVGDRLVLCTRKGRVQYNGSWLVDNQMLTAEDPTGPTKTDLTAMEQLQMVLNQQIQQGRLASLLLDKLYPEETPNK